MPATPAVALSPLIKRLHLKFAVSDKGDLITVPPVIHLISTEAVTQPHIFATEIKRVEPDDDKEYFVRDGMYRVVVDTTGEILFIPKDEVAMIEYVV